MKNQITIRQFIIRSFLVLSLAAAAVMPLLAFGLDQDDPQEGDRGKRAPRTTCSTSVYNLMIFKVVVTECSDGTRSVSVA